MRYLMKIVFLTVLMVTTSYAQKTKKNKFVNVNKKGLAVKGYDVVSYFTGKPQKGKNQFYVALKGAKYLFVNKENLEVFKKNPEKYMPQYGGFCAYAIGKGYKYTSNPLNYKIQNEKLYLFFGGENAKPRKIWETKDLLTPANKNWREKSFLKKK